MSGDENGVVTRTVSSLSILQAIRSAPVTTSRVLRRTRRADDVTLARHILAWHDEAETEPTALSPEPDSSIIAAANATIADLRDDLDDRAEQIAGLRDRCDDLFATGRRKDEQNAELRAQGQRQAVTIGDLRRENAELRAAPPEPPDLAHLEDLTVRAERAEQKIAAAVTALRPLAKLKGPTVADRARVTSQVIIGLEADGAEVIIP